MIRRRRLRASENLRALVRETSVSASDLIYPVFVIEGKDIKNPIDSMPGIYQYSIDRLDEELDRIREAGVKGVLLFGIPAHKDECGTEAYNEHGIIQEAIRYIKKVFPELVVIADICLCEYTSHGHCGVIKDGIILNDETLPLLAKASVSYAKAGADIIAPSDMMDLRVKAIREATLLIVDDIGATTTYKDWDREKILALVDFRYKRKLLTIYTSNVESLELKCGDRAVERIYADTLDIKLPEVNVRRMKADKYKQEEIKNMLEKAQELGEDTAF